MDDSSKLFIQNSHDLNSTYMTSRNRYKNIIFEMLIQSYKNKPLRYFKRLLYIINDHELRINKPIFNVLVENLMAFEKDLPHWRFCL